MQHFVRERRRSRESTWLSLRRSLWSRWLLLNACLMLQATAADNSAGLLRLRPLPAPRYHLSPPPDCVAPFAVTAASMSGVGARTGRWRLANCTDWIEHALGGPASRLLLLHSSLAVIAHAAALSLDGRIQAAELMHSRGRRPESSVTRDHAGASFFTEIRSRPCLSNACQCSCSLARPTERHFWRRASLPIPSLASLALSPVLLLRHFPRRPASRNADRAGRKGIANAHRHPTIKSGPNSTPND